MHQTGKNYVFELDGMGKRMPVVFGCLTVASLSLMGIPLFGGFISKWNLAEAALGAGGGMYMGVSEKTAMAGHGIWLAYAGIGVILYSALMTGIYMLTVLARAYFPVLYQRDQKLVSADLYEEEKRAEPEESGHESGKCDPGWKMLVPLLVFAAMILLLGIRPVPLLELLYKIGGEAG